MRIVLSTTADPEVTGADDLKSLDVLAPAEIPADQLTDRLAPLGTVEGDHAWLDVARLRAAGRPDDEQWVAGFEGMVGYAASKGWLDPAGTAVRAHLTGRE
ncbi:MAG: hypothetical protein F2825_10175 [Actinobacteria bacterium]|uniref:Uncharacterized protein n=2 Tax=root TaxID=1 RepID=A0ABU8E9Q7_9ACTN|nr:hypothetical protein [Klenkia terrae]MSW65236.1 hypothetical protein [Actinomycetota bacterium]